MTPEQIVEALKALSIEDFMSVLWDILDIANEHCHSNCRCSTGDNCDNCDYTECDGNSCKDCPMQNIKG